MIDDLKDNFRASWITPGVSAVLVVALALGIGAYTAIFSNGGTSLQSEEQPGEDAEALVSHGLWQQRLGSNPAPSRKASGAKSNPCSVPGVLSPVAFRKTHAPVRRAMRMDPMLALRG